MSAILGQSEGGLPVEIDVERLIGSHACIVANAGGGKSGLIRRLLEQTHGAIQHIVLDSEDEFYTLRQRFDYVIAGGQGGDTDAKPGNAAGLATAALTHGFSLICQLNDLGHDGAGEFVASFLEAMISAPQKLWHPVLVVIDEAQRFNPDAIRKLTERGRKRGFTAILASQRLPKIDPNIRGDINNWLMGRVGQTLDRRIMADQLGMPKADKRLTGIEPREFYAFGPALAREPVLFHTGDVETTMVRPGQAKVSTPPPPEALRAILAGLATVEPAPAGSEPPAVASPTWPDQREEVDRLEGERDDLQAQVEKLTAERDHFKTGFDENRRRIEAALKVLGVVRLSDLEDEQWAASLRSAAPPARETTARTVTQSAPARVRPAADLTAQGGGTIPPGTRPTLAVLASVYPAGMTSGQLAARVGIKKKGSTFSAYKSRLRTSGLIEERDGLIFASEAGAAAIGDVAPMPEPGPELARSWAAKLPGTGPVVEYLLDHPGWCERDDVAVALGINPQGSTLSAYVSRLFTAGVISKDGSRVRLSAEVMGK